MARHLPMPLWAEGCRSRGFQIFDALGRTPPGILSRLPQKYLESLKPKPAEHVHWRPHENATRMARKTGNIVPVYNEPIDTIYYPPESQEGLWAGEGIIYGYKKKMDITLKPRYYRRWYPCVNTRNFYSEILDRHMQIQCTERARDLIDEAFGFDFYILKTPSQDLNSKMGMDLRREMLMALGEKSMYPDDLVKNEKIYQKYKQYEIPLEEAEWIGLSLDEAVHKQQLLEYQPAKPMKQVYETELVNKLRELRTMSGVYLSTEGRQTRPQVATTVRSALSQLFAPKKS